MLVAVRHKHINLGKEHFCQPLHLKDKHVFQVSQGNWRFNNKAGAEALFKCGCKVITGRARITSPHFDSQAPLPPHPWPGWWPIFTALFQASRTRPFCFLCRTGSPACSCSQDCELKSFYNHVYTHTQRNNTNSKHILFLCASPQSESRMPLSDVKMTPGAVRKRPNVSCQDKTETFTYVLRVQSLTGGILQHAGNFVSVQTWSKF